MKVFISWSGDLSLKIAIILRDWLPMMIQRIDPYVSSEDIDKGTKWPIEISRELASSTYGILCITPNNLEAPWLNFEAGALSTAFDTSKVSPFLFGVDNSDISNGPLSQFQTTKVDREDIKKLVISLNKTCDSPLDNSILNSLYDRLWPDLESRLNSLSDSISKQHSESKQSNNKHHDTEVLHELLELTQRQYRLINSPELLLPKEYLANSISISSPNRTQPVSKPAIDDTYVLLLQSSYFTLFSIRLRALRNTGLISTDDLDEFTAALDVLADSIRYISTYQGIPFADRSPLKSHDNEY